MKKQIIILLVAILLIPFLGSVHLFDWDEINFAESAREMLVTSDYSKVQIAFKPFHEKPPLFIWLQAISMKMFGVGEFAARLPNAIAGIIISVLLFARGKREKDELFGIYWVVAYLGSFLPFFYFKTGIIDPIFNGFILWSILKYLDFIRAGNRKDYLISIILISLAVLTKGPVGVLLAALSLVVFLFSSKYKEKKLIALGIYFLAPLIIYLIWYLLAFGASMNILSNFVSYHLKLLTTGDSGHSGPFYYHFPILIFGVFPASFFAFKSIFKSKSSELEKLLFILLIVVVIIFSIVQTKIVHYSSLAYFPITFFAAKTLYGSKKRNTLAIIFGFLISLAIIAFPIVMQNAGSIKADKFTEAILKTDVSWGVMEMLPGLLLFAGTFLYAIKNKPTYLFLSVTLTCFTLLPLVAPKIEKYTQAANINFWESVAREDAYLQPLGYKSYAHYFYGELKQDSLYSNNSFDDVKEHLLNGKISKPAYFSVKFHKYKDYKNSGKIENGLDSLYMKNGFIFLRRNPSE